MPYQPCYTKLAYIESENPTEGGKFFLIDPADIDELPEASHVWSVGEEIQYRVIKTGVRQLVRKHLIFVWPQMMARTFA